MREITNKTEKMKEIEREWDAPIEEVLRSMYVDHKLPVKTMCSHLSISYVTCLKWLYAANITSRGFQFEEGS